ncbi:hypothetical protein [Streptomyces sp. NPDC059009]|uniref:hypothetical protein n=1 Tax=Streptomyces sp. NPDC059009 TaxID=3346694 RepID=UPI0036C58A84
MSQQDRSPASDVPVYAALVKELGDVPAETRREAEKALREAQAAVDFKSSPHAA